MAILDLLPEFGTTTVISVTLLVLLLTYLYMASGKPKGSPPGPPALPLVGSLPFISLDADGYIEDFLRLHKKHGDIISIKFGSQMAVVIKDYELLKEVFIKRGLEFAGRPTKDQYERIRVFYPGDSSGIILGQYGEQWKLQRHTSMTILRNLGYGKNRLQEIIAEEAQELCKLLANREGETFDLCALINVSIANVICSLLFGERYDHSDKEFAYLRQCVDQTFKLLEEDQEVDFFPILLYLPYYKGKLAKLKEAVGHLRDEFAKKIQARKIREEGEPRDFIEGYLRALKENENLENWSTDITQDFFQAGAETTTTTLGWGFYYMIKHPEIQAKVQEELDKAVGQSREVTLKDKENLPYTEACVAEISRLSCTVPIGVDHMALGDTEINGYRITKGTLIYGNLWAILRNPEVFPDPETFRPERFIQEDGTFQRHEQIINFSIGRRSCMGEQLARQELFLFFTHILQKFRLSVPEGQTHPPPKGSFAVTHRPPVYKVVAHKRM